jgi:peptidoglycan/LPS O-acetylase OafA/YrhL
MSKERRFDLVRGLAAIAVLVSHVVDVYISRLTGQDQRLVHAVDLLARHAVLVFFLLSGYLITLSILANIESHRRFDALAYLSSRITRIYPPLCGALAIVIIAWALIHGFGLPGAVRYGLPGDRYAPADAFSLSAPEILSVLAMQGGLPVTDGPLWSLYAEFHIYILAMLGALAWSARTAARRYLWLALAVLLGLLWVWRWTWFSFFALVWLLGAAAALADPRQERVRAARRLRGLAAAAAAGALVLWLVTAHNTDAWVVDRYPLWQGFVVQALCSVCYAYLLFRTTSLSRIVPAALVGSGNYSYSLYLIHCPLLLLGLSLSQNWVGHSLARALLVASAAFLATLCAAAVFARYFEEQRRFRGPIERALRGLRAALGGLRLRAGMPGGSGRVSTD